MDERGENVSRGSKTAKRNRRTVTHKWSDQETIQLIQLVEERQAIWNFGDPDYKKLPVRDAAWREIADRFNNEHLTTELNIKWQNLRSQFRKEYLKLTTKKSGQAAGNPSSTWKYFDAMRFVAAAELKLSTTSVSNVVDSDSDIDAVCNESMMSVQPLSQPPRRAAAAAAQSVQSIPDLSSGCAIRKRKKQRQTDVSVYAEKLERAMDIIGEPEDEYQVFGNYIASLLRNITNNDDSRRIQRKVTLFALNCIDELEAGPSSRKVEESRPTASSSPPVLLHSMPTCSLESETEMDLQELHVPPEIYEPPNFQDELRPSTPELYVPPSCVKERRPSTSDLYVPPNFEYEMQPSTPSAPQTEEDISLDVKQTSSNELHLTTRNGELIQILNIVHDSSNKVRLVAENGDYIDESISQHLLSCIVEPEKQT